MLLELVGEPGLGRGPRHQLHGDAAAQHRGRRMVYRSQSRMPRPRPDGASDGASWHREPPGTRLQQPEQIGTRVLGATSMTRPSAAISNPTTLVCFNPRTRASIVVTRTADPAPPCWLGSCKVTRASVLPVSTFPSRRAPQPHNLPALSGRAVPTGHSPRFHQTCGRAKFSAVRMSPPSWRFTYWGPWKDPLPSLLPRSRTH